MSDHNVQKQRENLGKIMDALYGPFPVRKMPEQDKNFKRFKPNLVQAGQRKD